MRMRMRSPRWVSAGVESQVRNAMIWRGQLTAPALGEAAAVLVVLVVAIAPILAVPGGDTHTVWRCLDSAGEAWRALYDHWRLGLSRGLVSCFFFPARHFCYRLR